VAEKYRWGLKKIDEEKLKTAKNFKRETLGVLAILKSRISSMLNMLLALVAMLVTTFLLFHLLVLIAIFERKSGNFASKGGDE
jgi:hypothetical protein